MEIALSPEAAEVLERLVARGMFTSREEAIESAIARLAEADDAYLAELRAKVLEAHASLDAGGGSILSRDLAEDIYREAELRGEKRVRAAS